MNTGTVITILILVLVVCGAIALIVHNRKAGKSSCGGDCSRCMSSCNFEKKG